MDSTANEFVLLTGTDILRNAVKDKLEPVLRTPYCTLIAMCELKVLLSSIVAMTTI
jgi:hypothetical protein